MARTLLAGLVLALAGAVTVIIGAMLNLGIDSVFFGLAVGGVLAFVNDESSILGRLGAFLVGVVVTMIGYIARILVLNDSVLGQILFAILVAGLITLICAATAERLPLWGGLLGAVLVAGAYETQFLAAPQNVETDLIANVTSSLVPMAIAFLAGVLVKPEIVGVGSHDDEEIDEITRHVIHEGHEPHPAGVSTADQTRAYDQNSEA